MKLTQVQLDPEMADADEFDAVCQCGADDSIVCHTRVFATTYLLLREDGEYVWAEAQDTGHEEEVEARFECESCGAESTTLSGLLRRREAHNAR